MGKRRGGKKGKKEKGRESFHPRTVHRERKGENWGKG